MRRIERTAEIARGERRLGRPAGESGVQEMQETIRARGQSGAGTAKSMEGDGTILHRVREGKSSWGPLGGLLGASWGLLGASWEPLGGVLEIPGGVPGHSWEHLCSS